MKDHNSLYLFVKLQNGHGKRKSSVNIEWEMKAFVLPTC